MRPTLRSAGRPTPRRKVERKFWRRIAGGLTSEDAAAAVGVSGPVGTRWFRQGQRRAGDQLMAATKNAASTEAVKQITYLASALKAPRITEAAARLADQARDAGWTHEDYLAAVLEREVSTRNASGAHLRIRAAGFGAVKTLEDFDFDAQPTVRQQVGALALGS